MDDDEVAAKRRRAIAETKQQLLMWVAAAAAVVGLSAALSINFMQRIIYQGKVNGELAGVEQQMKQNADSVDELIKNIDSLKSDKNLNLSNLKADGATVYQVLDDTVPTSNDRTILGASLQEVLDKSAITVDQISVDSNNKKIAPVTVDQKLMPAAQTIDFKMRLKGNYDVSTKALGDIERSIRPVNVKTLRLAGNDGALTMTFDANTYYNDGSTYTTSSREVKP